MKTKPKLSDVLEDLKQGYLDILHNKIEMLDQLLKQNDWARLAEEFHKLKGTGATYGFPELSVVSEKLESLAQNPGGQRPALFQDAIRLLERMHQTYSKKTAFSLEKDSFARSLLALKVK